MGQNSSNESKSDFLNHRINRAIVGLFEDRFIPSLPCRAKKIVCDHSEYLELIYDLDIYLIYVDETTITVAGPKLI